MVYIGFTSGPRVGGNGWRHAIGEITLGDASEPFTADLHAWSMADYEAQWREGIARLAAGQGSSAFVTSYGGPDAVSHIIWPIWRTGATVVIQEQLVVDETISNADVSEQFYSRTGERRTLTGDGTAVSEWMLPFGDLLAFLADE